MPKKNSNQEIRVERIKRAHQQEMEALHTLHTPKKVDGVLFIHVPKSQYLTIDVDFWMPMNTKHNIVVIPEFMLLSLHELQSVPTMHDALAWTKTDNNGKFFKNDEALFARAADWAKNGPYCMIGDLRFNWKANNDVKLLPKSNPYYWHYTDSHNLHVIISKAQDSERWTVQRYHLRFTPGQNQPEVSVEYHNEILAWQAGEFLALGYDEEILLTLEDDAS